MSNPLLDGRKVVLLLSFRMKESYRDLFSAIGFTVLWEPDLVSLVTAAKDSQIDVALEWADVDGETTIMNFVDCYELGCPILLCSNCGAVTEDSALKLGFDGVTAFPDCDSNQVTQDLLAVMERVKRRAPRKKESPSDPTIEIEFPKKDEDAFDAPPAGITRSSIAEPQLTWKFIHGVSPAIVPEHNATTGYLILWEGANRDQNWIDANWESIWSTYFNDDDWTDFGDGFVIQEVVVEWEGAPPQSEETFAKMAGRAVHYPIQFNHLDWNHTESEEVFEMGIWTRNEGLYVEPFGSLALVTVFSMIRSAENPQKLPSPWNIDIEDEGDSCVQAIVPYDKFREQYQKAVPPKT